ncbi:SANT/Myb domain [Macleaya cordata]|uniref:SANT/Myb domain n=1 Tax=Macleaya cordata TaxID=56857 RepID=A0A200QW07_MACCD|nr:SANT/Myb domain [Macleaya cordata]
MAPCCSGALPPGDGVLAPSPGGGGGGGEVVVSDGGGGGGTRISNFPQVMKRDVKRPHSSVLSIVAAERASQFPTPVTTEKNRLLPTSNNPNLCSLENISYGQLQALSSVLPPDQDKYVCTPPPIIEGRGVVKRFGSNGELVVPMHADWFSPNSVHRLERQIVPHFFSRNSGDHTPEKYMECRNRIVAKYMENPEKRISVTDCQSFVVGVDVNDLNRIVRFLEHWGIINYSAATPNREPKIGSNYLMEDQNGEVHVPSAALRSIESLIHFDKPKSSFKPAHISSSASGSGDLVADLENRIWEVLSENMCSYCSRPLPRVNYQSQKEDIVLCSDCFHEGRFVTGHSSIDFVRADSTKDSCNLDGDSWTDQETLLLLEAVEIYNNNWDEIAEHVGTKSKAQCATHFIRLPMEDYLLENIEVPSTSTSTNPSNADDRERLHSSSNGNSVGVDVDSKCRLPFATTENPVMSLVAFLAYAVGPRVAAACAHGSLEALSKGDQLSIASNSIIQEDRIHDDSVKMAAKVGLAAATVKAKLFADHGEREIQRLTANVINHQLKRLELKLKQFAELEGLLMKECENVERTRRRFAAERARLLSTQFGPAGTTTSSTIPGAVANNAVNDRQQIISATPPLHTNISGYSNNQPSPHMSFMQRQPMFAYGPRLPLSAIHPPSSASSSSAANVMFTATAPGNASASSFG